MEVTDADQGHPDPDAFGEPVEDYVHAVYGTKIGKPPPERVAQYLHTVWCIPQAASGPDDHGRIPWQRIIMSIDGSNKKSVPRDFHIEKDIIHARLFLDPVVGSFARIAVHIKWNYDTTDWTPLLAGAFFSQAFHDANHEDLPYEHMTNPEFWKREDEEEKTTAIEEELNEAWAEWTDYCEGSDPPTNPLRRIMAMDRYDYGSQEDAGLRRELWEYLAGKPFDNSQAILAPGTSTSTSAGAGTVEAL